MRHHDILREVFHYDQFRGVQEDIIRSVLDGKDTLGLMPTGGGKSLTFQIPALAMDGLCLVVTPLIALMRDQVERLRGLGILAQMINSFMSPHEIETGLKNCIYGDYKFLYISPERMSSEMFQRYLVHMKVCLIAVDESHCISQWGYDFRPSYLKIAALRFILPGVPVLALTATATPEVVTDIQRQLGFPNQNVFRMSFERKNLRYVVRDTLDRMEETIHILSRVSGCGIVYVRSRRRTLEVSQALRQNGISALPYHAGMTHEDRDAAQNAWQADSVRIIVATSAFGMGIDKPGVRIVIHYDLPDSIEAYFQEAGRAGRDGKEAFAVLLYDRTLRSVILRRTQEAFPTRECILSIYEQVQYFLQMPLGEGMGTRHVFDMDRFCLQFSLFSPLVENALRILTLAGCLTYEPPQVTPARLMVLVSRESLYRIDLDTLQERLMREILRTCEGVFSQYAFISLSDLGLRLGLSKEQVYQMLRHLTLARVVDFIPPSKTAHISYPMPRIDPGEIVIREAVYEKREEAMARKISQMLAYAEEKDRCRSQMLLEYFGQNDAPECQQCDTCLRRRRQAAEEEEEHQGKPGAS